MYRILMPLGLKEIVTTGSQYVAGLVCLSGIICAPIAACAAPANDTTGDMLNVTNVAAAATFDAETGWATASGVTLGWDFTNGKPARETTHVAIVTDATQIHLRFDVVQHEPIVATQHVNDTGDGTDDEVSVYLWPSGRNGFRYQFSATPNGTHYQYSTEKRNLRAHLGPRTAWPPPTAMS